MANDSLGFSVPADLNKACGNTIDAHEAAQMHQNFSQQLLQDHIAACSLPEHNLISVSVLNPYVNGLIPPFKESCLSGVRVSV